MRSLYQEEVEEDFPANVEDQADINRCTTTAFGSEVPRIDQETCREDEAKGA